MWDMCKEHILLEARNCPKKPLHSSFFYRNVPTSGWVKWARFLEPTLPDRWSRCTFWRHGQEGQAAKYVQNGAGAVWNFGPLWRGISVESDPLYKLKPRSVTQLSVIFLLAISKNTPFLEWPSLRTLNFQRKLSYRCSRDRSVFIVHHHQIIFK